MADNISKFKDSTPLCTMEKPGGANVITFIEKPRDPWHLIYLISFRKSTGVINFQLLTTKGGMKARVRTYEASGFHIVTTEKEPVQNRTTEEKTDIEYQEVIIENVQNRTTEVTPPAKPKRARRKRITAK